MYQSPQQSAQWPPSTQPPQQQPGQQSPPTNWSSQPPNGQYTATPRQQQIPPITQAVPPPPGPAMATMQPPHPDQYRALPPPQHMYAPPYPHPGMPYPPQQPAPRQRTAIACRYCRRRKIRCSGFDQAEDGRCTNCIRFSQECVFTPVSAQTQAFVPAHTVWRGHNPPPNTQLYGAYGQPLPPGGREPYPPQQQPQGQYPPPPQGYQQPGMYPQPPQQVGTPGGAGQKRSNDEPHTPTLPPPQPGTQAQLSRDGQYGGYPDQPPLAQPGASPSPSSASFYPNQAPFHPVHYQPALAPPYAAYTYSPYAQGPQSSAASGTLSDKPVRRSPPTPAGQAGAQRQSMAIHDIVGASTAPEQQAQAGTGVRVEERSSTDSIMVHSLNQQGETDGAAAAVATTTPMTDGQPKPEPLSTKKIGVDAGVQVNLIGDEHVPSSKE